MLCMVLVGHRVSGKSLAAPYMLYLTNWNRKLIMFYRIKLYIKIIVCHIPWNPGRGSQTLLNLCRWGLTLDAILDVPVGLYLRDYSFRITNSWTVAYTVWQPIWSSILYFYRWTSAKTTNMADYPDGKTIPLLVCAFTV